MAVEGKKHHPPKLPAERPGPEGGKRDANRRAKVQCLCEASLQLFCERGVEAVTIDEVVSAAGVAKGSFYRYFSGKEELVETIFSVLAIALRETFAATKSSLEVATTVDHMTKAYAGLAAVVAPLLVANRDILRLYLQENRGPNVGARKPILEVAREIDESVLALTRVARDQGLLRSDYNVRVGVLASLGAVERLLLAFVRGEELGSPARISADLIGIVLEGVRGKTE